MQLLHTKTLKGSFYFINGKRVNKDAFELAKFWRRVDTFITQIDKNGIIRHRCQVRI